MELLDLWKRTKLIFNSVRAPKAARAARVTAFTFTFKRSATLNDLNVNI